MNASRRKLTLLDMMVLIAAVAAGIAGARAYFQDARGPKSLVHRRAIVGQIVWSQEVVARAVVEGRADPLATHRLRQRRAALYRRIDAVKAASSLNVFFSIWTLALVGLGLRKPRPPLRRLTREPGWSGCLAAVLILAVRTVAVLALWGAELSRAVRWSWPPLVAVFDDLADYAGPAVVAVWVVLVLGGRCRRDRSALGWLLLITASSWVLLIVAHAAIVLFAPA